MLEPQELEFHMVVKCPTLVLETQLQSSKKKATIVFKMLSCLSSLRFGLLEVIKCVEMCYSSTKKQKQTKATI